MPDLCIGAAAIFVIDPEVRFESFTGVASAYALTPAERRMLGEIVSCAGLGETAGHARPPALCAIIETESETMVCGSRSRKASRCAP